MTRLPACAPGGQPWVLFKIGSNFIYLGDVLIRGQVWLSHAYSEA